MLELLQLLMVVSVTSLSGVVGQAGVRVLCAPTSTVGAEFEFQIRAHPAQIASLTGLEMYEAASTAGQYTQPSPSDPACLTTTVTDSIYKFGSAVDVDQALTCGIVASSSSGVYNFAFRLLGTATVFTFSCDVNNLLIVATATTSALSVGRPQNANLRVHTAHSAVTFEVIGKENELVPTEKVKLGKDIKLRLTYQGRQPTVLNPIAASNWGWKFHTGSITHPNAAVELIIITPGRGTMVQVTGSLFNSDIDTLVAVKRDEPVVIEISGSYLTTNSTATDWKKEMKGLTIEALNAKIGVRLVSRSAAGGSGAITVMPDTSLGQAYRLATGSPGAANGEILIVATDNSTAVTLTYNTYTIAGLQVNGVAAAGSSDTVTLDESETLHLLCGSNCHLITVTSDKNIAIIGGNENQLFLAGERTGHMVFQLTPSTYIGTTYILLGQDTVALGITHFLFQFKDIAATGVTMTTATVVNPVNDNIIRQVSTAPNLMARLSTPTMVYATIAGNKVSNPSSYPLPSIRQFSTRQVIYMEEGYTYHVTVISVTGDIAGITVTVGTSITIGFTAATLGQDTDFAARTASVIKAEPTDPEYQVYRNTVDFVVANSDPTKKERGLVEFGAAAVNKPFLLVVSEVDAAQTVSTAPPFGIKYVATLDGSCSTTTPIPDDGVDNDCDGKVDEEKNNGIDDDGDGRVDEDVAMVDEFPNTGVRVTRLEVSDNSGFTSPHSNVIHVDGCNPNTGYSLKSVTSFRHVTGLSAIYSDYWILETLFFGAFRYLEQHNNVYFRVWYDFCHDGNMTLCENSCGARKRRSADEQSATVKIRVTGADPDKTNSSDASADETCDELSLNVIQWAPITILIIILAAETSATAIFLYKKRRLIGDGTRGYTSKR